MGHGYYSPPPCKCLGGYCLPSAGCPRREKKEAKPRRRSPKHSNTGYMLNGKWVDTHLTTRVWINPLTDTPDVERK